MTKDLTNEDLKGLIDKINEFATLPSREDLLSMLASVLQAPVRNVAYAINAVIEKGEDAA